MALNLPKLRRKKVRSKSYAVAWYDGKDHIFGEWGSKNANEKYRRFVAEIASGKPVGIDPELTVTDIAIHYASFAKAYYHICHKSLPTWSNCSW